MTFKLPKLKYEYDGLEPHIDARTLEIHLTKHHQSYVDNLNKALEGHSRFQEMKLEEILKSLDQLPEDIKTAVRNNGGGHYNHTMFWEIMSPQGGSNPKGDLLEKINRDFGSFEDFKENFKKVALGQFASGWAWLVLKPNGKLAIESTPNHDNPISKGDIPLLVIDVWEHAYYLNYQNRRADFIDSWWNIVDWNVVSEKLNQAK